MGKNKKPKTGFSVIQKQEPRIRESIEPSPNDHISWALSIFDLDGPWGAKAIPGSDWIEHLKHLRGLESMRWSEICKASGSKSSGTKHHYVDICKISQVAQKRLRDIRLDDIEKLFSISLTGKVRIYGIFNNNILKILWFDPWHDERNKGVCPSIR